MKKLILILVVLLLLAVTVQAQDWLGTQSQSGRLFHVYGNGISNAAYIWKISDDELRLTVEFDAQKFISANVPFLGDYVALLVENKIFIFTSNGIIAAYSRDMTPISIERSSISWNEIGTSHKVICAIKLKDLFFETQEGGNFSYDILVAKNIPAKVGEEPSLCSRSTFRTIGHTDKLCKGVMGNPVKACRITETPQIDDGVEVMTIGELTMPPTGGKAVLQEPEIYSRISVNATWAELTVQDEKESLSDFIIGDVLLVRGHLETRGAIRVFCGKVLGKVKSDPLRAIYMPLGAIGGGPLGNNPRISHEGVYNGGLFVQSIGKKIGNILTDGQKQVVLLGDIPSFEGMCRVDGIVTAATDPADTSRWVPAIYVISSGELKK